MDKINPVKSPRARAQECSILKASSCLLSGSHEQPNLSWQRCGNLQWSRTLGSSPPPCPLPALFLWKNLSQRVSLIREVRKYRNSPVRLNNNSLVIKHDQRPLVTSHCLEINPNLAAYHLWFCIPLCYCSSVGKESACNAGDPGLIPGSGRSPGRGHGNLLRYSCLENPHGQRSLVGYNSWGHTIGHYWATNTSIFTFI